MKEKIKSFWMNKKHIVLFGLSRNNRSVSHQVYKVMIQKGYQIYPVNPNTTLIDSITCYKTLDDIDQKLDGAIIITNPQISASLVKKCQQKGITDLWFQLDTMDTKLREYCHKNSINYIYACILIYREVIGSPNN